MPILQPGRNCWQRAHADRTAFLVDGEAYFGAVASAMAQAQRRILILGWDIDSRIDLYRDGKPRPLPSRLGPFLNALLKRNKALHIYILSWDFAMIYAFEREPLPMFNPGWHAHRRLHFKLDGVHPVSASHHQKIVVVDDVCAFSGGFDLARSRWDTPEHKPDDDRRTDPSGERYSPFHDVQMAVDAQAASALSTVARERWRRASGETLQPLPSATSNIWPEGLAVDVQDVDVAIARTQPRYDGVEEIREVEALVLDSIAAAQHMIYIENQYLTSAAFGDALAKRLQSPDCPEIVIVGPRECSGWLEETTMGALRARLLQRLRKADRFDRLRVYFPGDPQACYTNVHSKVMIIDDRLLRIGSANLSNRSMGFDTECDLAIEAGEGDVGVCRAVTRFRDRLLGEHLNVAPERVSTLVRETGSLIAAVESLLEDGGRLHRLDESKLDPLHDLLPDAALIDPERPIDPERLIEQWVPREVTRSAHYPAIGLALMVLAMLALAAAWHFTPLKHLVKLDTLVAYAEILRAHPLAPLAVIGVYVIGSLLLVPITLMIAATALTFDPVQAATLALVGALVSGSISYGLGRWLGRNVIARLAGHRLNRLSVRLKRRGLITVISLRMLPIAPFTIINLVAGASRIRYRDFALGTLIGMSPGILALSVFASGWGSAIRNPSAGNFALLLVLGVGLIVAMFWARAKLNARAATTASETPE